MQHHRTNRVGIVLVGVVVLLLAAFSFQESRGAASAPTTQVVEQAWARARQIGAYRFSTDILQTTAPLPMLVNNGRSSRQDAFHLEGKMDLHKEAMQMRLWQGGGSVLDTGTGFEFKIEQGVAYGRTAAGGDWQQVDDFTGVFAPGGDPLAFLSGAKDFQEIGRETRRLPGGELLEYTRYSFELDGVAFADYVRDQLEDYLRARGELPPGTSLDLPDVYRYSTGAGEIWLDSRGLPLRLITNITFPPGKTEQVGAHIRTDFSDFGEVTTPLEAFRTSGLAALAGFFLPLEKALSVFPGLLLAAGLVSIVFARLPAQTAMKIAMA